MAEWKLVPVEPTPEMLRAGGATPGMQAIDSASAMHQLRGNPLPVEAFADGSALQQAYRAMLAAAPAGQAEGSEDPRWWSPPDSFAKNWLTNGAALHPLTANLVVRFARALAQKLAAAEVKYGYSDGWRSADWMDECRAKLMEHVAKGDPRDVAAYCAFLWHHSESTTSRPAPQSTDEQIDEWALRLFELDYEQIKVELRAVLALASPPPVVQQAPVQPAGALSTDLTEWDVAPQPAAQSAVSDEQIKPLIIAVWGANLAHPDIERRLKFARAVLALATQAERPAGEEGK